MKHNNFNVTLNYIYAEDLEFGDIISLPGSYKKYYVNRVIKGIGFIAINGYFSRDEILIMLDYPNLIHYHGRLNCFQRMLLEKLCQILK